MKLAHQEGVQDLTLTNKCHLRPSSGLLSVSSTDLGTKYRGI